VIDWGDDVYRLVDLPEGDFWQLVSLKDGHLKSIEKSELLAQYRLKKLRLRALPSDTRDLGAVMREATDPPVKLSGKTLKADEELRRLNKIRDARLIDATNTAKLIRISSQYPLGSPIQELAIRQSWKDIFGVDAPEKLPSVSSLWRWEKELNDSGNDVRSLIKKHHLKGPSKDEVDPKVAQIIAEATAEVYLTMHRRPMTDVEAEVISRISAENTNRYDENRLSVPPFERIKEHIQSLSAFEKHASRYGLPSAQRKFRAVLSSVFADLPLERVELDATPVDFIAVNDKGVPMGRPWLHVCIDVRTRCILGYYISYEPPSLATLFECLKHAILPKDQAYLEKLGVKNKYPCYGAFEKLVVDNALENHSDALYDLLNVWGGVIQNCPRAAPWYKARIERFIRTFGEQVCQILPGATFSDILERDDYDAVENAVIHWRDFERIVAIWVVDIYHLKEHSALQCSPLAAWMALQKEDHILVPCDVSDIEQVCRVPEIRRLTHKGIESLGLYWNSDKLTSMRYEVGAEVDVRVFFNRMNLGVVGVEHPKTREIVEVRALAFEYADNLTLFQHKVTRKFAARFRQSREENVLDWIDAQKRILEIIEQASLARGYCLPKGASRFLLGNGKRELPEGPREVLEHESILVVVKDGDPAALTMLTNEAPEFELSEESETVEFTVSGRPTGN
jgi:putative transposase